mmetsp:Transcript_12982/g.30625  ORF Transcript_12982/g.30625 Transcript_12982/m.30625 type:complete len:367 (+) Transcript_12982:218-1318(+)
MAPFCNDDSNAAFYAEEEEELSSASIGSSEMDPPSSSSSSTVVTVTAVAPMTPPTRRTVSFSAGAAVHVGAVINVDDYTAFEKQLCWFHPDELREIRREVRETVAMMNRNERVDETHDEDAGHPTARSTRGLEGRTRSGKSDRKKTRNASLAAVFDEQALQEMDGIRDPDAIAVAYSDWCENVRLAAYGRARRHRQEEEESAARDRHPSPNEGDEPTAAVAAALEHHPWRIPRDSSGAGCANAAAVREEFTSGGSNVSTAGPSDEKEAPIDGSNPEDAVDGLSSSSVSDETTTKARDPGSADGVSVLKAAASGKHANSGEKRERLDDQDQDHPDGYYNNSGAGNLHHNYNFGEFLIRNRFAWLAFQ